MSLIADTQRANVAPVNVKRVRPEFKAWSSTRRTRGSLPPRQLNMFITRHYLRSEHRFILKLSSQSLLFIRTTVVYTTAQQWDSGNHKPYNVC
jgi:hypothetical protein